MFPERSRCMIFIHRNISSLLDQQGQVASIVPKSSDYSIARFLYVDIIQYNDIVIYWKISAPSLFVVMQQYQNYINSVLESIILQQYQNYISSVLESLILEQYQNYINSVQESIILKKIFEFYQQCIREYYIRTISGLYQQCITE